MNIRQMEAVVEAMEMAYDALTNPHITEREKEDAKANLLRIGGLLKRDMASVKNGTRPQSQTSR